MDKHKLLREFLISQGYHRTSYSDRRGEQGDYTETWSNGKDVVEITWG